MDTMCHANMCALTYMQGLTMKYILLEYVLAYITLCKHLLYDVYLGKMLHDDITCMYVCFVPCAGVFHGVYHGMPCHVSSAPALLIERASGAYFDALLALLKDAD